MKRLNINITAMMIVAEAHLAIDVIHFVCDELSGGVILRILQSSLRSDFQFFFHCMGLRLRTMLDLR